MRHRPDIDGLRAVAVLPVLLYHAEVPGFGGGFVGVDVFFVISGFLITGLIAEEMQRGGFSLLRFYERRARRILPALFVVTLACWLLGAWLLLPAQFEDFGESLLATLGFFSNVHFLQDTGYFAAEAAAKPLLHTWSLAVEEQFYLAFPLLLLLLRGGGGQRSGLILVLLTAISLAFSLHLTRHDPDAAFYLGHARAWELLLGALLALGALPPLPDRWRDAIGLLGLASILGAVVGFHADPALPGVAALLPCLGAALVLLAGMGDGGFAGRLLASRPLVAIGLVSYSLYLWHWPVLAFLPMWLARTPDAIETATALAVSGLLAVLSWRFVEQPFRRPVRRLSRRGLVACLGSGALLLCGLAVLLTATEGFPQRLPAEARAYLEAKAERPRLLGKCFGSGPGDDPPPCGIGAAGLPVRLLLWGDSHAAVLGGAIDRIAADAGVAGIALFGSACPPALGVQRLEVAPSGNCIDFSRRVLDYIQASDIRLVILHARWPLYVEGTRVAGERGGGVRLAGADNLAVLAAGLGELLDHLAARDIRVVLVAGVPEVGVDVATTLARMIISGRHWALAPARAGVDARQRRSWDLLREAAARHGALLLDPRDALCDAESCAVARGGRALYSDDDHLSLDGVAILEPLLAPVADLLRQVAKAP